MSYTEFKEGYIEALLWSETDYGKDGNGEDNFGHCGRELDDNALAAIDLCCADFWQCLGRYKVPENMHAQAGYDFCLTRNGHWAGFWDGDWPEPLGEELTKEAQAFGTMSLCRIDDDTITTGG